MSGTSKGRKSKNMRPGSKKNSGQNQTLPYDGAYGNARLVHVLLSVMGKKCKAKVRNGGTYEGIFHAFNPKMDVSINEVHKCDKNYHHNSTTNGIDGSKDVADCPREEELIGEMAFPSGSLVSATFEDVDMSFAQLEVNEANGESTSQPRSNFKSSEKKLEPWNGGGDSELDPLTAGGLEGGLGSDSTNGWGADEMFRTNQEKYGVKSDYDSSLSNYTMQLDIKDKDDDAIAKATRLAQEIESGSDYKRRIDLELDDGTTEEDKFSAVTRDRKDRGSREMRDRDNMRDIRDGGEGYREKDRGDRERDRDHPISPQGYRNSKHDYDRFHLPNRNRGRGRDSWDKRNQQGYTGSNMGPPRSMGSGNQSSGGGRNQQPMSPIDGPTGAGGSQNKPYRGPSSGQTHLPPRFTKTGSGGHSREDDRMRQNESNSMHSPYQAPKGSRQRMQRSGGRQPAWGGPTSPPAEYQHHSPTQMHQDPAVISSGPSAGGSGGPPLSRSSSNSSNTSAPVQQNHRKHLSTSSQDEQTTPQHPSAQQHHPHLRQTPSSSPTGGPPLTKNQQQPPQQPSRPPQMPPPMPGTGPTDSWASIASRNPVTAKQMGHGMSDMGPSHMGQGSPSGIPQQSPRSSIMPGIVNVRSNATYTWTPRGGTPPTSNMPNPYPVPQSMNQQMPNMGNPRVHPSSQQMHPMGGGDHMQGQMVPRGPPPQQIVTSPQQQQHTMQPQMPAMPGQHGPRPAQPGMKVAPTTMPQENSQKVQPEKSEENIKPVIKKPMDAPPSQSPGGSAITELKEFSQRFKLPTDMKKDTTKQSSTPQPVNQQPPPPPQQQRPPQNMTQAYPSPQQQHGYQHPPPHQSQSYNTGAMGHPEHGRSNIQHNMQQNQVSIQQGNQMIQQQQKSVHPSHPGPVNQIPSHPQQMSHVQIPMAAPSIQQFAAPVPSSQHPPMQLPPRPMDSPKILTNRMMQQPDKNIPPVQQKPLTSPKADMSNFQQHNANIHVVVTGTPVPQTNPSAVITVSAAASSPIVSPHAPAPVPQNPQPQRQSPVTDQAAPPSSTPSIEPSTTPVPSTPQSSNAAITSPTAGIKALNPEAQEFKPRTTPAKPSPVATRATTPQANMPIYVPAYVSAAVASGMGPQTPTQIATPVYNSAQVPQMHAPEMPQMYTQYPQQYIPLVQQIPGQQFAAAFDQAGQAVYASPAPQQAMMAQNARMAATIQGTPQQHIPQYQSDQGQGAVYVPVPPQGPNFMQQRPHSAHTPTQVTHVTAASPATQANQQSQQPTGHPTQTMVHGVQTAPVWMPINPSSNIMMVPSGQPPQQLQHASGMQMNAPPPQHTHYLSALPAGQIPSSVPMNNPAQQKGQQQQQMTGHYMPQPQQRSYGQYQSPSANNQG